ncbi:MAG: hypothetical protein VB142_11940 [Burkholderia sp.]
MNRNDQNLNDQIDALGAGIDQLIRTAGEAAAQQAAIDREAAEAAAKQAMVDREAGEAALKQVATEREANEIAAKQAVADREAAEVALKQATAERETTEAAARQAAANRAAAAKHAARLPAQDNAPAALVRPAAIAGEAPESIEAAPQALKQAAQSAATLAAQAASDKATAEQALREAEQKEVALEQAMAQAAKKPAGKATAANTKLVVTRPAQDTLTLAIGGHAIPLTPVQLSQLIEELAYARASMTPEQPNSLPTGWRFVSTRNPMMAVQKQANGDRLLVARHTGYGWVPFTFSPDTVIQVYMLLTQ